MQSPPGSISSDFPAFTALVEHTAGGTPSSSPQPLSPASTAARPTTIRQASIQSMLGFIDPDPRGINDAASAGRQPAAPVDARQDRPHASSGGDIMRRTK